MYESKMESYAIYKRAVWRTHDAAMRDSGPQPT